MFIICITQDSNVNIVLYVLPNTNIEGLCSHKVHLLEL